MTERVITEKTYLIQATSSTCGINKGHRGMDSFVLALLYILEVDESFYKVPVIVNKICNHTCEGEDHLLVGPMSCRVRDLGFNVLQSMKLAINQSSNKTYI